MDTIQHNPARLYNCEETGITTAHDKHTKILGFKGNRQISFLQSAERRALVTVVTCMSPTRNFISRYLYFQEKIWNKHWWMAHRLDHSTRAIPRGGYRARFFSQCFLHFIKQTKPTKEDPVILVMDGYYSHTRNLEVINLAQEYHVDIICLPPHSSHKMQPLDKAFMGPLKIFYCQEIEKWLRLHPERVVTIYQIGELFGSAYKRAATGEIEANGFRATGLFPCDKNIFRPRDFPLSSEDKNVAPVNHPALVKTSDQSSFSSANFSLLLRLSDRQISALCQAWT